MDKLLADKPFQLVLTEGENNWYNVALVNEATEVPGAINSVPLGNLTWEDLGYGNVGFYKTIRSDNGMDVSKEEVIAFNSRTKSVLVRRSTLNQLIGTIALNRVDYSTLRLQLELLADDVTSVM